MKDFFSIAELAILIDLIVGDKNVTPFRQLTKGHIRTVVCLN